MLISPKPSSDLLLCGAVGVLEASSKCLSAAAKTAAKQLSASLEKEGQAATVAPENGGSNRPPEDTDILAYIAAAACTALTKDLPQQGQPSDLSRCNSHQFRLCVSCDQLLFCSKGMPFRAPEDQ